ncbi:hypothetical protein [Streptomyces sp. 900105755]
MVHRVVDGCSSSAAASATTAVPVSVIASLSPSTPASVARRASDAVSRALGITARELTELSQSMTDQ